MISPSEPRGPRAADTYGEIDQGGPGLERRDGASPPDRGAQEQSAAAGSGRPLRRYTWADLLPTISFSDGATPERASRNNVSVMPLRFKTRFLLSISGSIWR